jgi:uncharacterized protein (DUF488 family)
MQCLNLGYQGRTLTDFCRALVANQVEVLIDVRLNPWSQRPEFRKTALQAVLAEHGVSYIHRKDAGNPYKPKTGEKLDFANCAKKYARYVEENPQVIDALLTILITRRTALLCYEANREECHRSILLSALKNRRKGIRVVDI